MNLSDVFEYMSPEDSDYLFTTLGRRLYCGGYLVYWNLFCNHHPPSQNCGVKLLVDITNELQQIDRVFFFEVNVLGA